MLVNGSIYLLAQFLVSPNVEVLSEFDCRNIPYLEHVGLREAKVAAEVPVVEVDERVRPVPEHARLRPRERERQGEASTGVLVKVKIDKTFTFIIF